MLRERPRDEVGSLGSLNTDELSTVRYLGVEVDDVLKIAEVDSEVPGQSRRALPVTLSGGFGRKVEVSHERIFNLLESDPPALGSATQWQPCVSHIPLFEPKSYGHLDNVYGLCRSTRRLIMIRRREFIAGLGGARDVTYHTADGHLRTSAGARR
jgi:hypothetical protein